MTENEQADFEDRLDRLERYGERDHTDLVALRKEFDALKTEFSDFRGATDKTLNLLMWFTEQVRSIAKIGDRAGLGHAKALDTKAHEILEELKTRLRQSQ